MYIFFPFIFLYLFFKNITNILLLRKSETQKYSPLEIHLLPSTRHPTLLFALQTFSINIKLLFLIFDIKLNFSPTASRCNAECYSFTRKWNQCQWKRNKQITNKSIMNISWLWQPAGVNLFVHKGKTKNIDLMRLKTEFSFRQ